MQYSLKALHAYKLSKFISIRRLICIIFIQHKKRNYKQNAVIKRWILIKLLSNYRIGL